MMSRDCFETLRQFITRDIDGKICILYGLRRTGKTTLLFQMISELPVEQTAYIKVKTTDNMSKLTKDLEVLRKNGCKYVFVDEITLMEDFINTAAILSDMRVLLCCPSIRQRTFSCFLKSEMYFFHVLSWFFQLCMLYFKRLKIGYLCLQILCSLT